jgi:hypothetical protein
MFLNLSRNLYYTAYEMAYKSVAKYRTIYVCKYGYKDVSGECERTYVYCIFSVTSEYSNKTQYNGISEESHIFYSTFRLYCWVIIRNYETY